MSICFLSSLLCLMCRGIATKVAVAKVNLKQTSCFMFHVLLFACIPEDQNPNRADINTVQVKVKNSTRLASLEFRI